MSTKHDNTLTNILATLDAEIPRGQTAHERFVRAHDLGILGGDELRPARNLIEYSPTIPWPDGPGELTAWHARERLHCRESAATCYVDPSASRADVIAYLVAVLGQVSASPHWPPRAEMSVVVEPRRPDVRHRTLRACNVYTGSTLTLVVDTCAVPLDVGGALARLAADVPATRADGRHRLVLDLRLGAHFTPLLGMLRRSIGYVTDGLSRDPTCDPAGDAAAREPWRF